MKDAAGNLFSSIQAPTMNVTMETLLARGVAFTEREAVLEIDLRALGALEIFGTENATSLRFVAAAGDVRLLLAASALFTLRATFGGKGLT